MTSDTRIKDLAQDLARFEAVLDTVSEAGRSVDEAKQMVSGMLVVNALVLIARALIDVSDSIDSIGDELRARQVRNPGRDR